MSSVREGKREIEGGLGPMRSSVDHREWDPVTKDGRDEGPGPIRVSDPW